MQNNLLIQTEGNIIQLKFTSYIYKEICKISSFENKWEKFKI